jgi:hypothetical protein
MTAVDLSTMADPENQDQDYFVPNIGHNAIVPDSVLPEAREILAKRLAIVSRVVGSDPLPEVFQEKLFLGRSFIGVVLQCGGLIRKQSMTFKII